jgi:Domain of unknown function (DUF6306)
VVIDFRRDGRDRMLELPDLLPNAMRRPAMMKAGHRTNGGHAERWQTLEVRLTVEPDNRFRRAEEIGMTAVSRLNELLEAERAGVDTLSRLFPKARSSEMQKVFEEVRNDEAWSCAGLVRSIKAMGGAVPEKKGDFAEKVMSEPTLGARLRLLNRGQG